MDFRNTIIILTSNLGSELLANQEEGHDTSVIRESVMDVVQERFRPEFLNRLDEVILFHRLFREHMDAIVNIQLNRLRDRLAFRKIELEVDQLALTWLADVGYDHVYGARPLKRVIQRNLENPMASLILEHKIRDGDNVEVTAALDKLLINGEDACAEAA